MSNDNHIIQDMRANLNELGRDGLKSLVKWFRNLSPLSKQFISIMLALTAVLAPLLTTIGFMTTGLGGLATAFTAVGVGSTGLMATLSPLLGLFGAISGIVLGINEFFSSTNTKVKEFRDMIMPVLNNKIFKAFTGTSIIGQIIGKFSEATQTRETYFDISKKQEEKEFQHTINMNVKAPKGVVEQASFEPTQGLKTGINLLEF